MKKRFVTTLIALIACIACALGLVACDDNAEDETLDVAGKTYIFDNLKVTAPNESEQDRNYIEYNHSGIYRGVTIAFDNNKGYTITVPEYDTAHTGKYDQNGTTIVLIDPVAFTYDQDVSFTVSENKITETVGAADDITITIFYVLQNN